MHGPCAGADARARVRRCLLLLACVLAATAALGSVRAQDADAVSYSFCSKIVAANVACAGSAVALVGVNVYDDYGANAVCAGAHFNGYPYGGGYACAYGYAYQCYAGSMPLQPIIYNAENYAQQMHGRAMHSQSCTF